MSRRSLLAGAAAVGVALGCRAPAHDTSASESAQLLATDRAWGRVSAAGKNTDSIVAYWTEDARVAIPSQAVLSGKTAIRGMVAGMMATPGFRISWMPDSAVVARSGDLGYTYGTNEIIAPDSAGKLVTTRGSYLTVWRKDADGRWRCVQDYSTPAPPTPGPA